MAREHSRWRQASSWSELEASARAPSCELEALWDKIFETNDLTRVAVTYGPDGWKGAFTVEYYFGQETVTIDHSAQTYGKSFTVVTDQMRKARNFKDYTRPIALHVGNVSESKPGKRRSLNLEGQPLCKPNGQVFMNGFEGRPVRAVDVAQCILDAVTAYGDKWQEFDTMYDCDIFPMNGTFMLRRNRIKRTGKGDHPNDPIYMMWKGKLWAVFLDYVKEHKEKMKGKKHDAHKLLEMLAKK